MYSKRFFLWDEDKFHCLMVKIPWICAEQTGEVLHKDWLLCSLITAD